MNEITIQEGFSARCQKVLQVVVVLRCVSRSEVRRGWSWNWVAWFWHGWNCAAWSGHRWSVLSCERSSVEVGWQDSIIVDEHLQQFGDTELVHARFVIAGFRLQGLMQTFRQPHGNHTGRLVGPIARNLPLSQSRHHLLDVGIGLGFLEGNVVILIGENGAGRAVGVESLTYLDYPAIRGEWLHARFGDNCPWRI